MKNFFFINPRGMCAGVERALQIIDQALLKYGAPIYVNHEIVHNEFVIKGFENQGVIFCVSPEEIPINSVYIFSAHGVTPDLQKRAQVRQLTIIDATCPLVEKVHTEAKIFTNQNYHILYIGHKNHPEAEGVMGISEMTLIDSIQTAQNISLSTFPPHKKLTLLTQTTLSIDETSQIIKILQQRFPNIMVPKVKDICYATQNRQDAVQKILPKIDTLLVIGSPNSSNSVRLVETANKNSTQEEFKAFLVPSEKEIPKSHLDTAINIGITSGASVPEQLVNNIFTKLSKMYPPNSVQKILGRRENITFRMPTI